jgi:hypothetical protein
MSYVRKICELSKRGDMQTIAEMMKGYFSDKKKNPWQLVNKNVSKFITTEKSNQRQIEILLPLRAGVFGALDILSFGLIDRIATQDVIDVFTKEESWKLGRRSARNYCLDIAEKLISNGKTRYLSTSALKRDGFGFLVPRVEESRWEQFKKAKPKKAKKELDLSKLENSVIGSKFLKEQMIMDTKLDVKDPRVEEILEAYELYLVDIEVDRSSQVKPPTPTEQITLNGKPVFDEEDKEEKVKRKSPKGDQATLTDFISEEEKKPSKRKRSKKGSKKK